MNEKTSSTRIQLPAGFVSLGDTMASDGQALFSLGRALRNPRSTLANLSKLAEEAGFALRINFERTRPAPSEVVDASEGAGHPGTPPDTVDPLANLQCLLRSVGEFVSLEWLSQRTEQEWVELGHYASDIAYGYSRPDYSTTVPRPSYLPQREEAGA